MSTPTGWLDVAATLPAMLLDELDRLEAAVMVECCEVCFGPLEESGRAVPPALFCSWCGSDAE